MDTDPETWRWVWLAASVVLTAGEMTVAGTFILIPFGLSALVAMVLAFAGVSLIVQWLVFVPLGGALFALFCAALAALSITSHRITSPHTTLLSL